MGTILLPIKPKYVKEIIAKKKLYEFRKRLCKRRIDRILIYSTSPIKKVIAEVEVLETLVDNPDTVWEITKDYSGTSKEEYQEYYLNCSLAVAFKLGKMKIYEKPIDLRDLGINFYPQSHVYMKE